MTQVSHFHRQSLDGWTYPLSHTPPPQILRYPGYPVMFTSTVTVSEGLVGSLEPPAINRGAHAQTRSPTPVTLPLLTPMDLSRYSAAFVTPAMSHASLVPKHERSHSNSPPPQGDTPGQTQGRFGFSQSPESVPTRLEFHPQVYSPVAAAWDPSVPRRPSESYAFHQSYFGGEALAADEAVSGYPRAATGYTYAQPSYVDWKTPKYHEDTEEDKTKNRRHVCPVCDKRFNRPSSLNTHMSVHTGAKPFQCDRPGCGRRFSVSSNLRRHEKTHSNRRAFTERSMSGDSLEMLTYAAVSTPMRPATGHTHSHSASSFPYAYPTAATFPGYQAYPYGSHADQTPAGDYSSPDPAPNTTGTGSTQTPGNGSVSNVSSFASMASVTGLGMGLDQYSIVSRRKKSDEMGDGNKSLFEECDTEGVLVMG